MRTKLAFFLLCGGLVIGSGSLIHGQGCVKGCVVGRPGGGVFSPYLASGEWTFSVGYHGFVSDRHYQGKEPFPELDPFGPENKQHLFSIGVARGLTPRLTLGATIPLHFNDFTLNRVPPGGDSLVRDGTSASGVGDISLRGEYWLLDTFEHTEWNISAGFFVKLPTGPSDVTDEIYGQVVPVDWSIQLGDGGWGFAPSIKAFYNLGRISLSGTALYLFNPENTNDTPAFFPTLAGRPDPPLNTVADQFSGRFGAALNLGYRWPVPTIFYRVNMVPVNDAIGKSEGFRRPATLGFVEPGFEYSLGRHTFYFSVAILQYVNIKDSPYSARVEDATVPSHVFMAGYSTRF